VRDVLGRREIEALADAFRMRLPQNGPPVDVAGLARVAGITSVAVSDRISGSGLLVSAAGGERGILLNRHETGERQRFTIAHEIGHAVLHPDRSAHEGVEDLAARRPRRERSRGLVEWSCDYFAACLLMPRGWINAAAREATGVRSLARMFAVSSPTMRIRLEECGHNRLLT
jgi:predicted transcriptional regulator